MELLRFVLKLRFFVFVQNADFDFERDLEDRRRTVKVVPYCDDEINKEKNAPFVK